MIAEPGGPDASKRKRQEEGGRRKRTKRGRSEKENGVPDRRNTRWRNTREALISHEVGKSKRKRTENEGIRKRKER